MSRFLFDGKYHGGTITGINITFRNTFKDNKPKNLDKFLKWLLDRRTKQGNIKSIIVSTEKTRQSGDWIERKDNV